MFVALARSSAPNSTRSDETTKHNAEIITDGSRWGEQIQALAQCDASSGRWQLIIDAPIHARNMSASALRQISSASERWNILNVASLAVAISEFLGPEFAFALVDKSLRRLVLVRDQIGSRPLYWSREGPKIFFSSSRERLLAAGRNSNIDPAAVAIYLGTGGGAWGSTEFLSGLSRVPHGGFASFSRESVITGQWWAPPLGPCGSQRQDAIETARGARNLLDQAIAKRIAPEGLIAAHVSGGIDSTGVAAIAARQLAQAGRAMIATYAWSPAVSDVHPDMGWPDERRRIKAFSSAEGVPTRFGGASAENFLAFLDRPLELEGTADLADEVPILKLAQADGVKIMLSGWGGDEVFSSHGLGYLSHLLSSSQWDKAARWMRLHLRSLRRLGPVSTMLWWEGIRPMLPDFLYRKFDPYALGGASHSLIAPDLFKQNRDQINEVSQRFRVTSRPNETMLRHFMAGHITNRIETWDVWSRQHGFSYTYPLTDSGLVGSLLSLDPEQHYPRETPRGLALEALADVLPAGIGKHDAANEALRQATRQQAWQYLATMERNGEFKNDCPWIDMKRFRERLRNPANQSSTEGTVAFLHMFTAIRIWRMWTRLNPK